MNAVASIRLESVTVDFPVYATGAFSLKNKLLRHRTGGAIAHDSRNRPHARALDNVNLAIGHGSRVGIVGGNGAGKTTLLRVLAGAYEPTGGRILRRGHTVALLNTSLGVDDAMTGYEAIMVRGLLLGMTDEQIRESIDDIAAFTELGDYLAMPVYTYSDGMRLRLAFAVCTCLVPDILLMDEWIGVGDHAFVEKAKRRLDDFVDRSNILVLASQNFALLERVCTTGVLLDAGRVQALGPIDEVLHQYRQTDR